MNQTVKLAIAAGVLVSSISEARVVGDINGAMTSLLGHAPVVTNVYDAQAKGLDRKATKFQPWSGSYWPDIMGGIANHWRDHDLFWAQIRFGLRYDVAKKAVNNDFKAVQEKFNEWDNKKLNDKLAPSEKYDLLVGDRNFTLTRAIIDEMDFRADHRLALKKRDGTESDSDVNEGLDNNTFLTDVQDESGNSTAYQKYDNQVEYRYWKKGGGGLAYWSGICDGWGPASIYLPRPVKPITVTGALGHKITFYPDDLKALGSYLFARTNTPYFSTMNYKFAGRKCDERGSAPDTDRVGYVRDLRCNDLDPGVFHLALINRIGVDGMGFVMDVDNNLKINNHPVASYTLTYFNPQTGVEGSLKNSMVTRFAMGDGYAKRRNPATKYLVGVKADLSYMFYIWPEGGRIPRKYRINEDVKKRNKEYDTTAQDTMSGDSYSYDLELDEKGNILGGEWGRRADEDAQVAVKYSNQPDFIWMANTDALPFSEMSAYAIAGQKKDLKNARPFGNMNWSWNGRGKLPEDWARAAKEDATWYPPAVGEKVTNASTGALDILPPEAKDGILKSAQPLSHIVYYLFDQARSAEQK